MPTIGRAVNSTLFVSPNGDNSNGSSWEKASYANQASTGTDFIFNGGTPISASAKSVTGGNDAYVSIKIQVI